MDMNTRFRLWYCTRKLNFDDPEECVKALINELRAMFESCLPLIKVKISSRDPQTQPVQCYALMISTPISSLQKIFIFHLAFHLV